MDKEFHVYKMQSSGDLLHNNGNILSITELKLKNG